MQGLAREGGCAAIGWERERRGAQAHGGFARRHGQRKHRRRHTRIHDVRDTTEERERERGGGERLTQGDHDDDDDDDAETCTRGCMGSPSRNEHPEPSRKSKPSRKKPCRCERRRNAEETEKKKRKNDPTIQTTRPRTNERTKTSR